MQQESAESTPSREKSQEEAHEATPITNIAIRITRNNTKSRHKSKQDKTKLRQAPKFQPESSESMTNHEEVPAKSHKDMPITNKQPESLESIPNHDHPSKITRSYANHKKSNHRRPESMPNMENPNKITRNYTNHKHPTRITRINA